MTDLQKRPGNWYVLYTRFQYTRRIASAILREQGHCFFPMQVVIRKWSDRVKKIETPLFLNYIFVHATPEERIRYLELEGALHYVSLMGKPVVVRDQAMDQLMILANAGADARNEPYLVAGDRVIVTNGIFKGFEGVLARKLKGARLIVRVPLLKQAVSVELKEEDLYRLESADVIEPLLLQE